MNDVHNRFLERLQRIFEAGGSTTQQSRTRRLRSRHAPRPTVPPVRPLTTQEKQANLANKILKDHTQEGLIDTMKFCVMRRIHPTDLWRIKKDAAWTAPPPKRDRYTGKLYKIRRYTHTKTGAVLGLGKYSTRIQFSPIKILGQPSNIRIDLVTPEALKKVIQQMTVELLPNTATSKTPWTLLWVALTRNMKLEGQRDFVFEMMYRVFWTTHKKRRYEPYAPIPIVDNMNKKGELRREIDWFREGKGNKARMVLYAKLLERITKGKGVDAEAAAGLSRIECTYHGSNYTARLATVLPPGKDLFLNVDGKPKGFAIDYPGLHALLLRELLKFHLPPRRKKPKQLLSRRRNALLAVEQLIRAAYPRARWPEPPRSKIL